MTETSRLLHIQSSPNLENSTTRTLGCEFVEAWLAAHPATEVDLLDLARDPLPHWGPDAIAGFLAADGQRTPAQQAAVDLSERLIQQIEAADVIVIGCPMYNMSMPTQLKGWLDYVSRPGRSFRFVDRTRGQGLVLGKTAYVILSRGGDYSQPPANAADFQEPMLRAALALIGITDSIFIRAEGQRMQEAPSYIAAARQQIAALAQ
jgi:FMN-dependent NADH-azoreductase